MAQRRFRPDNTGILFICTNNDFLSQNGKAWPMVKDVVEKVGVTDNLKRLHSEAHSKGFTKVLFSTFAFSDEDYRTWSHPSGFHKQIAQQQMFKAGTWGSEFHPDIKPCQEDIEVLPHKSFDLFACTDLDLQLRQHGVENLIIAGMPANICCESTGRVGMELGYYVVFLKDAIGAPGWDAYRASAEVNYPQVANEVLTVDEFLSAFEPARRAA